MHIEDYSIRMAQPGDVEFLPDIERAAGLLFKSYPEDLGIPAELYEQANTVETFAAAQQAGRLWVALAPGGNPVGFALAVEIAGHAHLEELDVLPSFARRGIGTSLLDTVCAWARDAGYPAVTLRTFRDVPWNAPYYQKQGFRVVESAALSGAHAELEVSEKQRGLPTSRRVTMVYRIAD